MCRLRTERGWPSFWRTGVGHYTLPRCEMICSCLGDRNFGTSLPVRRRNGGRSVCQGTNGGQGWLGSECVCRRKSNGLWGRSDGSIPHDHTAEDGSPLAAAPWAHPRKGGENRGRRCGNGETIRERILGRRARWSPTLGEKGRTGSLEAHRELLAESFREQPASSVAEAADRIEQLTGIRRGLSQTRLFLKKLGLRWQRMAAIPVPPKSAAEHVAKQQRFLADELRPRLDAAQAGQGHVFFVDAAHFVFGTFLGCLWSFGRLFVRAASGRQRFNVLGAWNAVTRKLVAVTNTTVVNTETMCELLRKVAARGLVGAITLVLDNAHYQRNATVQALATQPGITLLYLPSYSPNLNLIERLWKFIKRKELYGKCHARFDDFRTAIRPVCLKSVPRTRNPLKGLMTLNFQIFENVSLLSAYGTIRVW